MSPRKFGERPFPSPEERHPHLSKENGLELENNLKETEQILNEILYRLPSMSELAAYFEHEVESRKFNTPPLENISNVMDMRALGEIMLRDLRKLKTIGDEQLASFEEKAAAVPKLGGIGQAALRDIGSSLSQFREIVEKANGLLD